MEREIKFRWVGLNRKFNVVTINEGLTTKRLLDGDVLSFFNHSNRGEDGNCKFFGEDLYTGLKDKTGKEIYEGDICLDVNGEKRVVEYEYGSWSWEYWESPDTDWTIIGNIYENPELLK